jgi:hypothetical protein
MARFHVYVRDRNPFAHHPLFLDRFLEAYRKIWKKVGFTMAVLEIALFPLPLILMLRDYAFRKSVERTQARERREAANAREQKNQKRAKELEKWLGVNQVVVYFNTIAGVTAVLREKDYDRAVKLTEDMVCDERWKNDNVLAPVHPTFIFYQKGGLHTFEAYKPGFNVEHYTCGWLSKLHRMAKDKNIRLERKENIFVPFVNESALPFEQHCQHCSGTTNLTKALFVEQLPSELQPLT